MPPGKEGKIELAVEHTDGFAGEVSKSAVVTTNDPKYPNFNLILRARFKADTPVNPGAPPATPPPDPNAPLTVEPGNRWTTSALLGTSTSNYFYVYNRKPTPVHVKTVVPGGNNFTAKLEPLQDGRRYQVLVSSNPALKPGHYTQTVKFLTDSTAQPEISVELDLTVYPTVFASPTLIKMPTLPSTADLSPITWPTIYVRKVREQGLKIKNYSTDLAFLKLDLLTETEGQVYKIQLTLDKSKIKPGDFKGTIRIETNDPDSPLLEVPVQGSFK